MILEQRYRHDVVYFGSGKPRAFAEGGEFAVLFVGSETIVVGDHRVPRYMLYVRLQCSK